MNTSLSVGGCISFGWETFKKRPSLLVLATIAYFILTIGASVVSGFVAEFLGTILGNGIGAIATFLMSFSLNTVVAMGYLAFFIKAHDDVASASLSNFWHPQTFLHYVGASILLAIISFIGFILFIIPGFIALTVFMFTPYFVLDKGLGPIDALRASARITKGNRLRIFGLLVATVLISLLGAMAVFVGLLVAIPVTAVSVVHAYRRLSVAADANEAHQPLSGGEKLLVALGVALPVLFVVGIVSIVAGT